jgi:predicted DNA-binding WGR domain protein
MTTITLTRIDHARLIARFYVLDVQPDLFGQWCFIREWAASDGRAGYATSPARPKTKPTPRSRASAMPRSAVDMCSIRRIEVLIACQIPPWITSGLDHINANG